MLTTRIDFVRGISSKQRGKRGGGFSKNVRIFFFNERQECKAKGKVNLLKKMSVIRI